MNARMTRSIGAAAVVLAVAATAWHFHAARPAAAPANPHASNTAVLGSYGQSAPAPGSALPRPPAPGRTSVVTAPLDQRQSLAVWSQAGHVYAARFAPETGWTDVHALEEIGGEATELQLAGNGRGVAMAVWHHTLGQIQSLRFARFEPDAGWSAPDVVPGVLPRTASIASRPRLTLDEAGDATLQWPSAFAGTPMQVSRFDAASGWSQPRELAGRS
jgi:uncharacterized membrane protein